MNASAPPKPSPLYLILAIIMAVVSCSSLALIGRASAAGQPFNTLIVRLDRLTALTDTGGRVCAKPSATNLASTEASVQVTFPTTSGTDYVVNGTAANWTVNTSNLDAGQTAWPGIGMATNVTGKTVTFPSGDLTNSSTLYCFNFSGTNTLKTSSAAATETTQGTVQTQTSTPATIDQTTYSESIITNDQVVLSATVPPSFAFFLSGNTDSFSGNLSTSVVNQSTGRFITVLTNASAGWIVWAKDANSNGGKGALRSATAGNYNITGTGAVHTGRLFTTGGEDYGLSVNSKTDASGGGTVAINSNYDAVTNGSNWGSTLDPVNFQPIASSNGTANTDRIDFRELVTIGGMTPAASDYTDTLTFVGAGQF